MFYENPDKLSAYPDVLEGVRPIWTRDGSFGNKWHHAEVFIDKEMVTRDERVLLNLSV